MNLHLVGDTHRVEDQLSGPILIDSSQAVWKTLGTVAGVILTVLGLPGLREDVATWAKWLAWVQGSFPWWILLTAAVVVLAVTWWPNARKLRRRIARAGGGDRLAGRLTALECELIPIWFDVDLTLDIPQVLVTLRAINYLDRPLTLDRVAVEYFHLNRGPVLEDITSSGEVTIEPHQSREVYCRKKLLDSEIRSYGNCPEEDQYEAAVRISAKGRAGKQEVSYSPGANFRIRGNYQRYTKSG